MPQAFTVVAPCLAAFPEYRVALREALLERKLRHWDRDLRALAATALGALVPTDPVWAAETALPALRGLCLSPVLEARMWLVLFACADCMASQTASDAHVVVKMPSSNGDPRRIQHARRWGCSMSGFTSCCHGHVQHARAPQ